MNYADIKYIDVLNGEGLRVSLFVSGCRNYCKNCFNKDLWSFNYGNKFTEQELYNIVSTLNNNQIKYDGLSLLGGDPFEIEQIECLTELCKQVKNINKTIWCWTGYQFEDLMRDDCKKNLLKYIDVLIDGKFILEQKDLTLKFRGSVNQRVIDVKKSLECDKVILT